MKRHNKLFKEAGFDANDSNNGDITYSKLSDDGNTYETVTFIYEGDEKEMGVIMSTNIYKNNTAKDTEMHEVPTTLDMETIYAVKKTLEYYKMDKGGNHD